MIEKTKEINIIYKVLTKKLLSKVLKEKVLSISRICNEDSKFKQNAVLIKTETSNYNPSIADLTIYIKEFFNNFGEYEGYVINSCYHSKEYGGWSEVMYSITGSSCAFISPLKQCGGKDELESIYNAFQWILDNDDKILK